MEKRQYENLNLSIEFFGEQDTILSSDDLGWVWNSNDLDWVWSQGEGKND